MAPNIIGINVVVFFFVAIFFLAALLKYILVIITLRFGIKGSNIVKLEIDTLALRPGTFAPTDADAVGLKPGPSRSSLGQGEFWALFLARDSFSTFWFNFAVR